MARNGQILGGPTRHCSPYGCRHVWPATAQKYRELEVFGVHPESSIIPLLFSKQLNRAHRARSHFFSCAIASEDAADVALLPSGRYTFTRDYVEACCNDAGFASVDMEETVLYHVKNTPVRGLLVTARK